MAIFKGKILEVKIGGRSYPIETVSGEEELLANAITNVQRDLANLKKTYLKQDTQDLLAMTLFTYAMSIEQKKNPTPTPDHSALLQKINEIEYQLDLRLN
jgi:cell division protein ZapA (FtsZ GTPase activity inhibitor)